MLNSNARHVILKLQQDLPLVGGPRDWEMGKHMEQSSCREARVRIAIDFMGNEPKLCHTCLHLFSSQAETAFIYFRSTWEVNRLCAELHKIELPAEVQGHSCYTCQHQTASCCASSLAGHRTQSLCASCWEAHSRLLVGHCLIG